MGSSRRVMGHAAPGMRPTKRYYKSKGHSEPVSSIAGITTTGLLDAVIYETAIDGTVDTLKFMHCLEFIFLPRMNQYDAFSPTSASVLVLDNALTHNKYHISRLCQTFGVKDLYLPPYSYDLNPIELYFNTSKTYLQANSGKKHESIKQQWEIALHASSSVVSCGNYFEHCLMSV